LDQPFMRRRDVRRQRSAAERQASNECSYLAGIIWLRLRSAASVWPGMVLARDILLEGKRVVW